jgi:hypothetical protein
MDKLKPKWVWTKSLEGCWNKESGLFVRHLCGETGSLRNFRIADLCGRGPNVTPCELQIIQDLSRFILTLTHPCCSTFWILRLTFWTVQGSNPSVDDVLCTRRDRSWGPLLLLHNEYRVSFPGVKRPGRGVDHPPLSSAEVKERLELYLLFPAVRSWYVTGRVYLYVLRFDACVCCCNARDFSKRKALLEVLAPVGNRIPIFQPVAKYAYRSIAALDNVNTQTLHMCVSTAYTT